MIDNLCEMIDNWCELIDKKEVEGLLLKERFLLSVNLMNKMHFMIEIFIFRILGIIILVSVAKT
ncbi:hypothetical protein [Fictibacillus gelatini]|uniref:hypothetical protein n=1 Tax=Fictibacillus gelatini TaxID=225985 RepID=UPI0004027D2F|nr:hypothetical protein [Fictibacillus gelatini]